MHTNFSEKEKEGKAGIWSYVQLVTLLKIKDAMFLFITRAHAYPQWREATQMCTM